MDWNDPIQNDDKDKEIYMEKLKTRGIKWLFLFTVILVMTQSSKVYAYNSIPFNKVVSGNLSGEASTWYEFTTLSGNKSYTLTFNSVYVSDDVSKIKMGIYDEMHSLIDETISYDRESEQITVKLQESTKYYLKVENCDSSYTAGYSLKMTYTEDVSDTKSEAEEIDMKQLTVSDIASDTDVDYYKFTTGNEDLRYDIKFVGIDVGLNIYLLDDSDKTIIEGTSIDNDGWVFNADLKANTTYYLKITSSVWGTGKYSIQAITRKPSFHWSNDYSSCKLYLTNTDNSSDITYIDCYVDKVDEREATCLSEGRILYKANADIYTISNDDSYYIDYKEITIPRKNHTIEIDEAVGATCTTAGKTEGSHCSECNAIIVAQQIVPATGHNIVTDVGIAATCTTAGKTEGSHCSKCNEIIRAQQIIPATGHSIVTDAAVAATCINEGKTQGSHCSKCGAVIKAQQSVAKTSHRWTAWKVVKKPTVTSAGKKKRSCSICGDVKYAQISKVRIKNVNINKGKSKKITFNVLDKGDNIKKVSVPKNSKIKVKKLKNNQYQFIGNKKGTYKVTVTLKSNKKFTFKIVVK